MTDESGTDASRPVVDADLGVVLDVVVDALSGRGRLTVLRVRWHRDDPLAVVLELSAQPDHPSLPRGSWVVLRDFLRYGLEERTGDGVVRIWPDDIRDRVWLELERYGRPACISLPRPVVAEFLALTDRQVPSGGEAAGAAVDAAVDALVERLQREG